MMDWFSKSVRMTYFPAKDWPLKDKWVRLRSVAETIGLSAKAREKLEWIIFYNTVGKVNAKLTAEYFGISRKTLYKYLKRFDETNPKSLEEHSKVPIKTRVWTVNPLEEKRAAEIRNFSKCKWGKVKIAKRYSDIYGEKISTNKVQKIINKLNLYPNTKEHTLRLKRRRERKQRLLITNFERKPFLGYLWHTDTIIIWWYGVRTVIFTAIEETTKIAFARVYKNSLSVSGKDFLERLLYLSNGELQNIHHDNGSEFEKDFERACKELGITQVYSRARTPKDNPALERFNWTIQDEWLSVSDIGLDNIDEANLDLTNWLITYNNIRLHESLDYMTPLAYTTQNFKVSPMWSSSTVGVLKRVHGINIMTEKVKYCWIKSDINPELDPELASTKGCTYRKVIGKSYFDNNIYGCMHPNATYFQGNISDYASFCAPVDSRLKSRGEISKLIIDGQSKESS